MGRSCTREGWHYDGGTDGGGAVVFDPVGAVGALGLTYWALKRLNQELQRHLVANCEVFRSKMQEAIQRIEEDLKEIETRQIKLRETLPLEYVRRDEYLRHLNGKPA